MKNNTSKHKLLLEIAKDERVKGNALRVVLSLCDFYKWDVSLIKRHLACNI